MIPRRQDGIAADDDAKRHRRNRSVMHQANPVDELPSRTRFMASPLGDTEPEPNSRAHERGRRFQLCARALAAAPAVPSAVNN